MAGARLATAYASVSDFDGVIHSYYAGAGAPGLPAPRRKDITGRRHRPQRGAARKGNIIELGHTHSRLICAPFPAWNETSRFGVRLA